MQTHCLAASWGPAPTLGALVNDERDVLGGYPAAVLEGGLLTVEAALSRRWCAASAAKDGQLRIWTQLWKGPSAGLAH